MVGHVANVLRLDDKFTYFLNDNTGPVIQIWRLYRGRVGIVERVLYVPPRTVSTNNLMSVKAQEHTFV